MGNLVKPRSEAQAIVEQLAQASQSIEDIKETGLQKRLILSRT